MVRAEIIVSGLVQGIGFRFFVLRKAQDFKLFGYTKNQMDGNVLTVVEGNKNLILSFYEELKVGPMHAQVKSSNICWSSFTGKFTNFEVRRY